MLVFPVYGFYNLRFELKHIITSRAVLKNLLAKFFECLDAFDIFNAGPVGVDVRNIYANVNIDLLELPVFVVRDAYHAILTIYVIVGIADFAANGGSDLRRFHEAVNVLSYLNVCFHAPASRVSFL